jgi:hypothetical protein
VGVEQLAIVLVGVARQVPVGRIDHLQRGVICEQCSRRSRLRSRDLDEEGAVLHQPAVEFWIDAVRRLRRRAVGVAEQLGDDVAPLLAARLGYPLKPQHILAFDANQHPQLRFGIARMRLHVARVDLREFGVEAAGLRVGVCPGILVTLQSRRSLRSAFVALRPVTTSHVVGSTVRSITSV